MASSNVSTSLPFSWSLPGAWIGGSLTFLNLADLVPSEHPNISGTAYATNGTETIVGFIDIGLGHRAAIWQNGALLDLNDLLPPDSGWLLTDARDINNTGQIIGTGIHNGETRDFLLTVPEPSSKTLSLFAVVGGCIRVVALRRRKTNAVANRRR